MPPEAGRPSTSSARIRGGDVGAPSARSARGRPPMRGVEHLHLGRERRRHRGEGPRRRRHGPHGAVRRHGRGPHGRLRRPRGRRVLRLAGEGAQGRRGRQRARLASTSTTSTPATSTARRRSTARSSAGTTSTWAAAPQMWTLPGLRRPPRGAQPRDARGDGGDGRARRASRTSSPASTRSPTTSPTPRRTGASPSPSTTPTRPPSEAAELGGQVSCAPFDAPWVRMTMITDPQGATFIASQFVLENKDLGGGGRRRDGRVR